MIELKKIQPALILGYRLSLIWDFLVYRSDVCVCVIEMEAYITCQVSIRNKRRYTFTREVLVANPFLMISISGRVDPNHDRGF